MHVRPLNDRAVDSSHRGALADPERDGRDRTTDRRLLDGIAVTDESGIRRADFADLDAVLNLVGEVAGGLPEPEKVEDPLAMSTGW